MPLAPTLPGPSLPLVTPPAVAPTPVHLLPVAPNQAQTPGGVPAPTASDGQQALVAPQQSSRGQKRQLASTDHLSPVAPKKPRTRGGVTADTASARLQRGRGKKRWVAPPACEPAAPPGPSLPHVTPATAPAVLDALSPVARSQPQTGVTAPASTARASLEALFASQQIPPRLVGRLGPPSQPGSQVGVEDAAMDMEVPALSKPAQIHSPPSQPGSQVGVEDAAMDTEVPALLTSAQMLWPPSQPGSQVGVEDAAMDTEAPALPTSAQIVWPPSQPGGQVGVEDAAMDMEAPALPTPGQMLWPPPQPGSMAGGLGQSAFAQSGGMAAGFSADGGLKALFPHQGVGAAQPAAVESAGFAGTASGFSPSGPIRPRAVRASFQMPLSPLHPPLPVATAQGPSFGSLQSPAAAGRFQPCGPAPWQHIMAGSGSLASAMGAKAASSFAGRLTTAAAGPGLGAAGPGFTAAGPGFTAAGPGFHSSWIWSGSS